MKIKLINFGCEEDQLPVRKHYNDAGADVYLREDLTLWPNQTVKTGLGFGVEIPDGYTGFICPRSGMSSQGITCELTPIDSGYRGEIHAVVTNCANKIQSIGKGTRVGQLVVVPCVLADFVWPWELGAERETGAFGSTGK